MHLHSAGIVALGVLAFARIAAADTVTVFAAASLKDALDENVRSYQAKAKDRVVVSYAASSALAKQIEQGAPAGFSARGGFDDGGRKAAVEIVDQHPGAPVRHPQLAGRCRDRSGLADRFQERDLSRPDRPGAAFHYAQMEFRSRLCHCW